MCVSVCACVCVCVCVRVHVWYPRHWWDHSTSGSPAGWGGAPWGIAAAARAAPGRRRGWPITPLRAIVKGRHRG